MSVKSFTLEDTINNLLKAVETDDEKQATRLAVIMVGTVALGIERMTVALEKLATFEVVKVGDITLAGAAAARALEEGPSGITVLVSLTPDEAETVQALRRGDAVVIPTKIRGHE